MSTLSTFRWEFRQPNLMQRTFAEAELREVVGRGLPSFCLSVYLVRDEAVRPSKGAIDPAVREGLRVQIGSLTDEAECRLLANLGSAAAAQRAYARIWDVLLENRDLVERFGDDWLTETICGRRRARRQAVPA